MVGSRFMPIRLRGRLDSFVFLNLLLQAINYVNENTYEIRSNSMLNYLNCKKHREKSNWGDNIKHKIKYKIMSRLKSFSSFPYLLRLFHF